LYYVKPPIGKKTFNPYCRYSDHGDSYTDRISVQELKRKYKPKTIKNKNQLPEDFISKFILYSSNRGDVILDPFMGGFTTARVALQYGRSVIGFEMNENAVNVFEPQLKDIVVIDDPIPVDPTSDVLAARVKKRSGYKKNREKQKHIIKSDIFEGIK
jgi:site-specific DNA-methyltransferase (adenine-specific)